MDLEELKTELQIQLSEIQNSITDLRNSSQSSKSSQNDSLIFSELRAVLKEQSEQGKQNLNENAERLRSNASEINNDLKRSAEKIKSDLQSQLNTIAAGVGNKVSATLKRVEQNCISANNSFLESVKNGKAEIKKAVDDERKAIFSTWSNVAIFIFLGGFLTLFGYGIFQLHNQKNDLMNSWAESGVKSQIIKDYKKELMNADGKELSKLFEDWKKKNQK